MNWWEADIRDVRPAKRQKAARSARNSAFHSDVGGEATRMLDFNQTLSLITNLITSDSVIECPYCGHGHRISDPDVCQSVVSYWGDDLHDLSCHKCGIDFVVQERVTRQFTAARSAGDLEDMP
jgi:hypothetical protein